MSESNTDIFIKSSSKDTDIIVSSSLFTETTPSKLGNIIQNTSDSDYITKDIIKLHKKVLDSELIPQFSTISESSVSLHGGYSSAYSTIDLPINYSESSMTDSSALRSAMKYAYYDIIPDANYSSQSSSESSSCESETTPKKPKKAKNPKIARAAPKKVIKKTPLKKKTSNKKAPKKT